MTERVIKQPKQLTDATLKSYASGIMRTLNKDAQGRKEQAANVERGRRNAAAQRKQS